MSSPVSSRDLAAFGVRQNKAPSAASVRSTAKDATRSWRRLRVREERALLRAWLLVVIPVLITAASGCASSTAHVANTNLVRVDFTGSAVALPPFVEHIDAESGKPMEAPSDQIDALAARLQRAAVAELTSKNIEVVAVGAPPPAAGSPRTPERMYLDLKRLRSKSVNEVFETVLGPEFTGRTLLATRVRFHRGPSGSWNVNTGQITSAMERMVIDAHVYDLSTGREVWRQTLQLRTRPSISDAELRGVVNRLFSTLAKK